MRVDLRQPGPRGDRVDVAKKQQEDVWALLVRRNQEVGANRSFPLGVPEEITPAMDAVLKSFTSTQVPPALPAEAEVLRLSLLQNDSVEDPIFNWVSRYWCEQGDLSLMARIEQLELPLLASFYLEREEVVRKNKVAWTGRYRRQRVLLAMAKPSEVQRAVTFADDDGTEQEEYLSRITRVGVSWEAVRAVMHGCDDETYAKRAATRPLVKVGSVLKELGAMQGMTSIGLDELSTRLANRALLHRMVFACPRDAAAANKAAKEIVDAMGKLDVGPLTPPFSWWITGSDAYLLLANVDDLELANKLNVALASSYHVCARVAGDLVARFGKDAAPLMKAWLRRLGKYPAEKAQVEWAIKRAK